MSALAQIFDFRSNDPERQLARIAGGLVLAWVLLAIAFAAFVYAWAL